MASLVFCLFSPFKVLNRVLIWLINKMLLAQMLPLSLKIPISSQLSKRFPKKRRDKRNKNDSSAYYSTVNYLLKKGK